MEWRNEEFDLGGVNHLALVCSDMKRTVEFYTEVLGMRLIKTINLPGGAGQHFFFDMGGGNALAFFWFPDAPEAVPGISAPVTVPGMGATRDPAAVCTSGSGKRGSSWNADAPSRLSTYHVSPTCWTANRRRTPRSPSTRHKSRCATRGRRSSRTPAAS